MFINTKSVQKVSRLQLWFLLQWWLDVLITAGLRKSVFDIDWSCCVAYFFVVSHRQISSLSDRFLFWEMKKSHALQRGEKMQVAARAALRVSPRKCAGAFAASWRQTTFLLARGVLRRGDASEIVNNNIHYLQCDALERRQLRATILSSFELGVDFNRCSPFFKTAQPFKNLSTAHGILSEIHFNHIVCFCAIFP